MNPSEPQNELIEQLTRAESALDLFFTLSLDLFCIRGQDGYFKQLNPAWENLLGWTPSEVRSRPWTSFIHLDDVEASIKAETECSQKHFIEYENRYLHKNGSYVWLSWRVSRHRDGFFYGVAKDITAVKQPEKALGDKQTESKLRESERRFRAVFNQTFQLSSLLKLDGTVLEDNQTAIDFCQLERSEAVGHPFWNLKCWTISPETQERLKRAIAQAAAGNIVRYEEDILAPDDTVVTIDFSLKPLKDETGQVELLIAEGRDLTERKRIEQNLQRAVEELTEWRNRYEAADQINGLLFYKWNSQTEAVTWGHNVEQVFGYSREEVSGSIEQWMELIHPDDLEKIIQELNRVIASKEPLHIEYRMRQKDGTYITLEDKGLFYPDSSGNLNQMVGFVANITERKQAQEALRESEERWQLALRGNNDGIWDWNIKTNEVFYLARWKEMLGIEEHELSNVLNEWTTRIHPDDLPGVMQAVQEYLERKTPHYITEYRMRCKDGSYKWILGRGQAVWDETGVPLRMVGSHTDITKRKQAEAALQQALSKLETKVEERTADLKQANEQLQAEINERQRTEMALRQSEEQFRRVFDEATLGMGLTALDGRFFRMNQAWLDMLGYTESELKALTCADITHPEDWEQTIPYLEQVRKGEIDSFQREQRFLKKNQEILWGNLTSIVLREQGGGILCGLGMVEDITERKKALEALQQSEARYRAIVEDQTELICRFKPDGTLTFVNDAYCRYFSKERSELIGHSFLSMIPEKDQQFIAQSFSLSEDQPIAIYEHRVILPSGETRWQHWTDRAVMFDEQGNVTEFQGVGRDITERKQAEAEIRKALEKERELSELRSGFVSLVSHEFRTPLTTIQSSAEILERYRERLSEEKKLNHLTRIQSAVIRMTQLLEDVLTIGKAEAGKLKFEPSPIDLVAFCCNLVENMQMSASPQHAVTFAMIGDCIDAQMDEKLLAHIVTNLLSNAIKYSPKGGTIQFDLMCNSDSAVFRIQDAGIGIPKEDLEQLFESFGRASNVGMIPGTGLGLAIVKKCVDLHRGKISVDSEVGIGTTFTVTLPLNYD